MTALTNAPLVRSGSALIASNLLASGFGFLYWMIAARLFSVADVGLASAIIASLTLATNLSLAGLNQVSARFLPGAGRERRSLARRIQLVAAGLGLIGGIVFLAANLFYEGPFGRLGIAFAFVTLLSTLFTVQDSVLLGIGRPEWVPVKNTLFGAAKLVLLLLAATALRISGSSSIVLPWFISLAVIAFLILYLTERDGNRDDDSLPANALPSINSLAGFALTNHLASILLQLPPLIYPILVLGMFGEEATAYFYTSWLIVYLLMMTANQIALAMVTHASRPQADINQLLASGLKYTMALVLPGTFVLIVFGRTILSAFGHRYEQGYLLLAILALGTPVYAINILYVGIMRIRVRLRPILAQGAVAGLLTLGLVFPLGRLGGLEGLGLAFVLGQSVAAIVALYPLLKGRGLLPSDTGGMEGKE